MPANPDWSPVTELQFRWRPIPDLALDETATFEIKVNGITDPIYAVSAVKSLNTMPSILATITGTDYNILREKEKKSGKMVIKAEEVQVTTNNITVREVADPSGGNALVIQWPEPDIALFGGADMLSPNERYQVNVTVGATGPGTYSSDGWFNPSASNQPIYEYFLGYDVPAQMGTCVVEGPAYKALLDKMAVEGYLPSDLRVSIQYREVYANIDQSKPLPIPVGPGQTPLQFQNRGMSPWVPINTF
jgi:hypothetical protein